MDENLRVYLGALAGDAPASAFLELRQRVTSDTLAAEFWPAHDAPALAAAIERRAATTDVFIGCAPRRRRSGTKNDHGVAAAVGRASGVDPASVRERLITGRISAAAL